MMTTTIQAHYDGKVIVPDEPIDLPVNARLTLQVISKEGEGNGEDVPVVEQRLMKLEKASGRLFGPPISDEDLRREHLYDERA